MCYIPTILYPCQQQHDQQPAVQFNSRPSSTNNSPVPPQQIPPRIPVVSDLFHLITRRCSEYWATGTCRHSSLGSLGSSRHHGGGPQPDPDCVLTYPLFCDFCSAKFESDWRESAQDWLSGFSETYKGSDNIHFITSQAQTRRSTTGTHTSSQERQHQRQQTMILGLGGNRTLEFSVLLEEAFRSANDDLFRRYKTQKEDLLQKWTAEINRLHRSMRREEETPPNAEVYIPERPREHNIPVMNYARYGELMSRLVEDVEELLGITGRVGLFLSNSPSALATTTRGTGTGLSSGEDEEARESRLLRGIGRGLLNPTSNTTRNSAGTTNATGSTSGPDSLVACLGHVVRSRILERRKREREEREREREREEREQQALERTLAMRLQASAEFDEMVRLLAEVGRGGSGSGSVWEEQD